MIDVTVKIPEDRVPEFYQMYGAWLNGHTPAPSPSASGTADEDSKGTHVLV